MELTDNYMYRRLMRTTIKMIYLLVLIMCVSFINKTFFTASLIEIGRVTDVLHFDLERDLLYRTVRLSVADILGIYLSIQYLEAFIDIIDVQLHNIPRSWKRGKRDAKLEKERLEAIAIDDKMVAEDDKRRKALAQDEELEAD